jgi:branched-chain amino acid transport system ATP-binding protein
MVMRDHAMLQMRDLHAYYGKSHILHGVDIHVGGRDRLAAGAQRRGPLDHHQGRHGRGRRRGSGALQGPRHPRHEGLRNRATAGLGYVPENRDIFPELTVRENLMLGIKDPRAVGRWSMDDMFELFPRLRERPTPAACCPAASSRC